jgi:hypothetical protein
MTRAEWLDEIRMSVAQVMIIRGDYPKHDNGKMDINETANIIKDLTHRVSIAIESAGCDH